MIFTFWAGDTSTLGSFVEDWAASGHAVRVFTNTDARRALNELSPGIGGLFEMIRIPACRSDLARLALLHKFGGFYVDAHSAPGDGAALEILMTALERYEVVLFDREAARNAPHDVHIINSVIGARAGSGLIKNIISRVIRNLRGHLKEEIFFRKYVPYNIAGLTGAWNIVEELLDVEKQPMTVRPRLRGRVIVLDLPRNESAAGICLYRHYGYRKPGMHWSERQNREMLFIPPPA